MKKVICVIPARLHSKRLPQKIIRPLAGKPLLQWTWEAAQRCNLFDDVVCAVDSPITADIVKHFGGKSLMTSSSCESGTERLVELHTTQQLSADIWVNWQADAPFITSSMVTTLLSSFSTTQKTDITTLKKLITNAREITSPDIVKVVCDITGNALYFSRSPIPYYREKSPQKEYFKHIGIYAYTTYALQKMVHLDISPLEQAEKLEQLRFLQNNMKIKTELIYEEILSIDTPHDLIYAQEYIQKSFHVWSFHDKDKPLDRSAQ